MLLLSLVRCNTSPMIDSYHMIEPLPLDFDWENEAATTLEAPDATPLGEDSELVKIWLDGGSDARTWSLNHHWPARCFALADRAGYKEHDVVGFSLVLEGAVQIVCICTLHVAMRAKGGHGQPGVRAWMRGKLRSTVERSKRSASLVVATSLAKVRGILYDSFSTQPGTLPGARGRIAQGIARIEGAIAETLANVEEEEPA